MGRLFWKFFALVWLAQLAVMIALGGVFWLAERHREAFSAVAIGPMAADEVRSAALLLKYAGRPGFDGWARGHTGPVVLALDATGADVLHRRVPPGAVAQLHALQALHPAAPEIAKVVALDGGHYTLFSLGNPSDGGGPPPGHPPQAWMRTMPPPPALAATLAASVLTALLLALYVAKPIRSLRRAFDAAAAGDLDQRVGPEIGARHDELAALGGHFDRMADRLKSSMAAQRRLLHDVSHELRSPLARVQAAVGLLREEPERLGAMTDRIERDVSRIDELVDELLTLSRLEAGDPGADQDETDMRELVGDVIENVRFEAESTGVQIIWKESGRALVRGVPRLLHGAVENVVRNALKHAGGGSIHVESGVSDGGAHYWLRVLDEGPGLDPGELESVFTPFFRGRTAAGSGHGLGLAIARRSIEAHGGTIRASNRTGGGLCVELVLPAALDFGSHQENTMQKSRAYSVFVLAAFAGGIHAQAQAATPHAIEAFAKGAQIYSCKAANGGYAWILKAPDATLRDAHGHVIGKHFAGPSWQAEDGSVVVGEPISVSPSPDAGAVTWIVLRAKSHTGQGVMASVQYVVRTRTKGGVAPATGCDASHAGAETRVPYSAVYLFFRG